MNSRALTMSLVMAVVAVIFVQSYVSSLEESYNKQFGTKVLVLKAKRDILEKRLKTVVLRDIFERKDVHGPV